MGQIGAESKPKRRVSAQIRGAARVAWWDDQITSGLRRSELLHRLIDLAIAASRPDRNARADAQLEIVLTESAHISLLSQNPDVRQAAAAIRTATIAAKVLRAD